MIWGGGKITIGGGNNGGVVPTGYSSSNVLNPVSSLGTTTANHTQIYSGGGNIHQGSSTATGLVDDRDEAGIYQWGRNDDEIGTRLNCLQRNEFEYQGLALWLR